MHFYCEKPHLRPEIGTRGGLNRLHGAEDVKSMGWGENLAGGSTPNPSTRTLYHSIDVSVNLPDIGLKLLTIVS